MSDFKKGTRNDSSNVVDWREFERGQQHQRNLDSFQNSFGGFGGNASGMVITGENPFLQFLVRVPFLVIGALLYPMTFVFTLLIFLLSARLAALFGTETSWLKLLSYIPAVGALWFFLRWDVRMNERHPMYRRTVHIVRVLVFGILGYEIVGLISSQREVSTLRCLMSAVAFATLGYFMLRSERWREFWYVTLDAFRIR